MSTDKPPIFNPYAPPNLTESHAGIETFQCLPDDSACVCHGAGIRCGSTGQLPRFCLVTGTSENLWRTSLRLYTINSGNLFSQRAGMAFVLAGLLGFVITAASDLRGIWNLSAVNYVVGLMAMLGGSLMYYLAQSRQVCVVHGFISRSLQIARFLVVVSLVTLWGTFWVRLHAQGNYSGWEPVIGLMIVLIAMIASEFLILRGLRLRATSLPNGEFLVEGLSKRFLDRLRTQAHSARMDPTPEHG